MHFFTLFMADVATKTQRTIQLNFAFLNGLNQKIAFYFDILDITIPIEIKNSCKNIHVNN